MRDEKQLVLRGDAAHVPIPAHHAEAARRFTALATDVPLTDAEKLERGETWDGTERRVGEPIIRTNRYGERVITGTKDGEVADRRKAGAKERT